MKQYSAIKAMNLMIVKGLILSGKEIRKCYILCDFIYIPKFLESENYRGRELMGGCQGF